MSHINRKQFTLGLLGLSLVLSIFAGTASAQATGDRTGTDSSRTTTRIDRDDSGFNPGWLGLVGLAGLAGLMPRKTQTVATHRTGNSSGI